MQERSDATEASNTGSNVNKRKRVALNPHRAEIEAWVEEARSDEWIANALGTTPSSVQSFRSRAGIKRRSGSSQKKPQMEPQTEPQTDVPSTGSHGSVYEGVLDQGEEGYGLWLDPSVAEDPVFEESFSGITDVRVLIQQGRIVLEPIARTGEQPAPESARPASSTGEGELERVFGSERLRQVAEPSPDTNREQGKVKFFDPEKGFGFIYRPDGSEIFFHKSQIKSSDTLEPGAEVTYEVGRSQRGLAAEEIESVQ